MTTPITTNATNTTTTTTTAPNGVKTHTAVLNTPPAAPALTAAEKLRARISAPKATTQSDKPITPKELFTALETAGTVEKFINAALDGTEAAPLVILASHVNRSECLKAAAAGIRFADLAAKHAHTYGLTAPEFIRLLAKLVIQDYNPMALTDTDAGAQSATQEASAELFTAPTTPATATATAAAPKTGEKK